MSTLHASDLDAEAMAQEFSQRYGEPRVRVPEVTLKPAGYREPLEMWVVALATEFSHRIATVDRPLGGSTIHREHFVEGIRHDLDPDEWTVTLALSPAEFDSVFWVMDEGQLGSADGLANTRLGW